MEIAIFIILFLVGTVLSAIQAMKYLELRQKRKMEKEKRDREKAQQRKNK